MQRLEVIPLVGVGAVRLGITRVESRSVLGQSFRQSTGQGYKPDIPADLYENGLSVYFDEEDKVHSIEVRWKPYVEVTLGGTLIFNTPVEILASQIAERFAIKPSAYDGGDSYAFDDLQLWLWGRREIEPEVYDDDDNLIHEAKESCLSIGIAVEGTFKNSPE